MSMESKQIAKAKATVDETLESPKARRAFELYYNEGIMRTEAEVASVIGVTPQTINKWKQKYDWGLRISQIQQGVYERRAIGKSRDLQDSVDETLGIIATIKTKYKTAMEQLEIIDAKDLKLSDIIKLTDQELKLLEIKYNYQKLINDTATRLHKEMLEYIETGDKSVIDFATIREKLTKMVNTSSDAKRKVIDKLNSMTGNE